MGKWPEKYDYEKAQVYIKVPIHFTDTEKIMYSKNDARNMF